MYHTPLLSAAPLVSRFGDLSITLDDVVYIEAVTPTANVTLDATVTSTITGDGAMTIANVTVDFTGQFYVSGSMSETIDSFSMRSRIIMSRAYLIGTLGYAYRIRPAFLSAPFKFTFAYGQSRSDNRSEGTGTSNINTRTALQPTHSYMMNNKAAPGKTIDLDFTSNTATNMIPFLDGRGATYYSNAQITIGTPGYITIPGGHDLVDNTAVLVRSTNTLPTGVNETTMYVKTTNADSFELAANRQSAVGDAFSGSYSGVVEVRQVSSNPAPALGQSLGCYMWNMELHDVAAGRDTVRRAYFAGGEGGMSIASISKGANAISPNDTYVIYDRMMRMGNTMHTIANNIFHVNSSFETIEFLHGEKDDLSGNDKDTYKAGVLTLFSDMIGDCKTITGQTDNPVVLFDIVAPGPYGANDQSLGTNSALGQIEIAQNYANSGYYSIGPAYWKPFRSSVHMSDEGVILTAEHFAYVRNQIYKNETPTMLYAENLRLVDKYVFFEIPNANGNLVIDTTTVPAMSGVSPKDANKVFLLGFGTSDANNSIVDVAVYGKSVILTLNSAPIADISIGYAYEGFGNYSYYDPSGKGVNTPGAWGNIRDSFGEPSKYLSGWYLRNFLNTFYHTFTAASNVEINASLYSIDNTGITGVSTIINTLIAQTAANGTILKIDAGTYLLDAPIECADNMRLHAANTAVFVKNFVTTGSYGAVTQANTSAKIANVEFKGGTYGVPNTASNATSGNIFALYGDDIRFIDVNIDGYSAPAGGRAFSIGGNNTTIIRNRIVNPANNVGAGGIRVIFGNHFRCLETYCESGDDTFQFVPSIQSSYVFSDQDIDDGIFLNCNGWSSNARLIVAAVGNQTNEIGKPGFPTTNRASIRNIVFDNIHGFSNLRPINFYNGDSAGAISNVWVIDSSFACNNHVSNISFNTISAWVHSEGIRNIEFSNCSFNGHNYRTFNIDGYQSAANNYLIIRGTFRVSNVAFHGCTFGTVANNLGSQIRVLSVANLTFDSCTFDVGANSYLFQAGAGSIYYNNGFYLRNSTISNMPDNLVTCRFPRTINLEVSNNIFSGGGANATAILINSSVAQSAISNNDFTLFTGRQLIQSALTLIVEG